VEFLKDEALPLLGRGEEVKDGEKAAGVDWQELARELLGEEAASAVEALAEEAVATGKTLARLPNRLDRTLEHLESGSVRVQVDMRPLMTRVERQTTVLTRLIWSVLAVGAGISGTVLWVNDHQTAAWILGGASLAALAVVAVGALGGLGRTLHRRFHKRRRTGTTGPDSHPTGEEGGEQ
jgi:hypothetical protein